MKPRTFSLHTLGCPKNQVDSDKITGLLEADGLTSIADPAHAELVVVNTCAFIEQAREESIDVILSLSDAKADNAKLVVTGCLAERYGTELADALPEVDRVAGFGEALVDDAMADLPSPPVGVKSLPRAPVSVELGRRKRPAFDLLNLPRPSAPRPWAYVKIAEGCDRACGFCAIPSFRGPQRSRSMSDILREVEQLDAAEIVLVAQDLAAYGRDQGKGKRQIVPLIEAVSQRVARTRLLYLYPADLNDTLIDAICNTGVPYFDLSLQHASAPLLRRMRRFGNANKFLERIKVIRSREPDAAFRSNFIVGYPTETEEDHDELLRFVEEAQLDWCGFFAYSEEPGTYSATLEPKVDPGLRTERLTELTELADSITANRRDLLVGQQVEVLVDEVGVGRSHREAPEIDGVICVPEQLAPATFASLKVTAALGCDLEAR